MAAPKALAPPRGDRREAPLGAVMNVAAVVPGWFGKLPSLGDFASRRLPDAFVQPWDRWLQRGMLAARAELGEQRWLDVYLVAPVLRFWLAPGLLGSEGWAGLMMPSVDRIVEAVKGVCYR